VPVLSTLRFLVLLLRGAVSTPSTTGQFLLAIHTERWSCVPLRAEERRRTLVITPKISPIPKNSLLCMSYLPEGSPERRRGIFDRRSQWPAMASFRRESRAAEERAMVLYAAWRMLEQGLIRTMTRLRAVDEVRRARCACEAG
jgi:hypothetical protein